MPSCPSEAKTRNTNVDYSLIKNQSSISLACSRTKTTDAREQREEEAQERHQSFFLRRGSAAGKTNSSRYRIRQGANERDRGHGHDLDMKPTDGRSGTRFTLVFKFEKPFTKDDVLTFLPKPTSCHLWFRGSRDKTRIKMGPSGGFILRISFASKGCGPSLLNSNAICMLNLGQTRPPIY